MRKPDTSAERLEQIDKDLERKNAGGEYSLRGWRTAYEIRTMLAERDAKLVALREALEEKVCHQLGDRAYECDLCGRATDDSGPIDHAPDCVLAEGEPALV